MEDIIVFLIGNVFNSDNSDRKCASHFRRQPANENKQLKETKTWESNS